MEWICWWVPQQVRDGIFLEAVCAPCEAIQTRDNWLFFHGIKTLRRLNLQVYGLGWLSLIFFFFVLRAEICVVNSSTWDATVNFGWGTTMCPISETDKRVRDIYHKYLARGNVMKTFRYTAFACIDKYFWSDCVFLSLFVLLLFPRHMRECKWLSYKCSCTTRLGRWHSAARSLPLALMHTHSQETLKHTTPTQLRTSVPASILNRWSILVGLWRSIKVTPPPQKEIYSLHRPSPPKDYGDIAKQLLIWFTLNYSSDATPGKVQLLRLIYRKWSKKQNKKPFQSTRKADTHLVKETASDASYQAVVRGIGSTYWQPWRRNGMLLQVKNCSKRNETLEI